jgi:DNA-3-methyladenine glycosylase II
MTQPMTSEEMARARRVLMRRDPVLGAIIKRYGECRLHTARDPDIYSGLIQSIISQQLSTKAAATIYGRFKALLPAERLPQPHDVHPLTDEALRGVGLSRQKIAYLRDLTARALDGSLQPLSLRDMSDDEVVEALTEIKGVGRWTAEMILIFRLLRPDVLPVDDLGIVNAIHRAYKLRKRPDAKRMLRIAEPWRPYRSVASWYLWRSLENV